MKFVKRPTPFLNNPSQCDPLAETYQVKSCDKIISGQAASISSPSEQRAVRPLKIMGVTVTGIDPRLISSASLSINAPLKAGHKKFIGVQKDARIRIKKNTQAHVSLELQRDALGHLLIKSFSISFNRSLIIKNPATACTPVSKNSKFSATVQDKLADVKVKKITMDETGSIVADGKIVKLR